MNHIFNIFHSLSLSLWSQYKLHSNTKISWDLALSQSVSYITGSSSTDEPIDSALSCRLIRHHPFPMRLEPKPDIKTDSKSSSNAKSSKIHKGYLITTHFHNLLEFDQSFIISRGQKKRFRCSRYQCECNRSVLGNRLRSKHKVSTSNAMLWLNLPKSLRISRICQKWLKMQVKCWDSGKC